MSPRKQSGTCLLCRAGVSKNAVLKHINSCLESSGWPVGLLPSFIIRVDDRQNPSYWLTILAKPSALLSDLDHVLRDVWMESGAETRSFTLRNTSYPSTKNGMDIPLINLLEQESSFTYEYGISVPTDLRLRVIKTTPVMPPEGVLCLIARNEPSFPPCSVCKDDAEYLASETGDDETAEYYCLTCLSDLEEAVFQLIENSPRKSVCATPENLNEMVKWYPPGWNIRDLASPEKFAFMMAGEKYDEDDEEWLDDWLVDDDDVANTISIVIADIGGDIAGFLKEERDSYGKEAAAMSEEMVMGFCTLLYGLHEKTVNDWDAPLMRICLLDEFVMRPAIPDEWQKNAVPILCRFITRMEANGRLRNAAVLTAALQEAEPRFQEIITSQRDADNPFISLMEQAMTEEPDEETFHTLCQQLVRELKSLFPADQTPEEYRATFESLFGKSPEAVQEDAIRYQMIQERCEDFCTRLDNEDIPERCKEMIGDLAAHPNEPLARGDDLLWSAAIVYAACREENIIGKAKGGSPLAREISEYFNRELSSIQSKVTVLRKRLAECPNDDDLFFSE